jgi:hypothetical protein
MTPFPGKILFVTHTAFVGGVYDELSVKVARM